MNLLEFEKKIFSVQSTLFLCSEEPFWIDFAIERIESEMQRKFGSVERIIWDNSSDSFSKIASLFEGPSLFQTPQIILMREIEKLSERELERLISFEIGESSFLILSTSQKSFYRQFSQKINSQALSIECLKSRPQEIQLIVGELFSREQKKITPPFVKKFIEQTGTDLLLLKNQVSLFATYLGEKREVTEKDLQHFLSEEGIERSVFEITRAVSNRDLKSAFNLTNRLIQQGEVPLRLWGLLLHHYRKIISVSLLSQIENESVDQISRKLNIPAFALQEYLKFKISPQQLQNISSFFGKLLEIDREMKTVSIPFPLLLKKGLFSFVKFVE